MCRRVGHIMHSVSCIRYTRVTQQDWPLDREVPSPEILVLMVCQTEGTLPNSCGEKDKI